MKDAFKQVFGKRISGLVVAESQRPPYLQIFLLFTDETYFEFYRSGSIFTCAGGIDSGGIDRVRNYISGFPEAQITLHVTSEGLEPQ